MKKQTILLGVSSFVAGYLYFHSNDIKKSIKTINKKAKQAQNVRIAYQNFVKQLNKFKMTLPAVKNNINDLQIEINDFKFKTDPKINKIKQGLEKMKN